MVALGVPGFRVPSSRFPFRVPVPRPQFQVPVRFRFRVPRSSSAVYTRNAEPERGTRNLEPGTRNLERETSLDDWSPTSCGEMDHQQDDADDEQNPGDLRSNRGNTSCAENTSNQTHHEKNQRVIQHSDTSLFP